MFTHLINLLFPKVCAGCRTFLLGNEKVICTGCRHELPLTGFHNDPDNDAYKKFYGRIGVEHVSSFMYYHKKGIVQEIIHSLKYRGHEEIGTVLGEWYAGDLKKHTIFTDIDFVVPVPLHPKKLRKRGFNQVTAFSKAISENLEIVLIEDLLLRKVNSETQSRKTRFRRTEVDETVFDVMFNESHYNKHFLLIDDVLTTGSTLEACGRSLLKIPGAKLSIITMAISHS